jgi:nucleoid-associated protein YgaU
VNVMTGALKARIVVPSVVLVALASTALVFGITHLRHEPLVEVKAMAAAPTALPSASPTSSRAEEPALPALTAALAETGTVTAALSAPPAAPGGAAERAPVFDVARIEPSGEAVIAGRAAPGASVELLRNGEVHDRAVADQAGQFVMVPPRLPAGDYELTLRSKEPDGKQVTSKDGVSVALHEDAKAAPVAQPAPQDRASVAPKPAPAATARPVAVELVDAELGKLNISGHSSPGAALRLYINNSYLASTKAAVDGRFAFTINKDVGPGSHQARLDEVVSRSGAVRSRAEVPFDVPEAKAAATDHAAVVQAAKHDDTAGAGDPGAAGAAASLSASDHASVPKTATAVVVRGDSLWRISRATYGAGERYTLIFGANHAQIRNPNRIYPGQVFVLPEKTP